MTTTQWPDGLLERVKAAEQRIQDNCAPRRIPADVTDVDLVLAEVRYLIEGRWPPFWIKDADHALATSSVVDHGRMGHPRFHRPDTATQNAIRTAELWAEGKMIGGDEDDVRNTLLAEVKRLHAIVGS